MKTTVATPLISMLAINSAAAEWVDKLRVEPLLDARYRAEIVDREDFADDAVAHTLRIRGGVKLRPIEKISILVEGEGVANLNDRFNSTTNGQTQFPIVADPEVLELNQAFLTYDVSPNAKISIGRQKINYGNQRFVGAVDFRQNQQTFDAARISVSPVEKLSFEYVYIDRVHRILGNENPAGNFSGDSHIFNAGYKAGALGAITAYGLLLDFEEAPGLSSATWGVRVQNSASLGSAANVKASYAFEFARQSDYGSNAADYAVNYGLAEAGLSFQGLSAKVGYEHLGGDGASAFSTPLATLHKFQGFADAFLATPADGVEDLYVVLGASRENVLGLKKLSFTLFAHDFQSARGGDDFGNEIDLKLAAKITQSLSAELKGAFFDGGDFGPPDRTVFWASIRFSL